MMRSTPGVVSNFALQANAKRPRGLQDRHGGNRIHVIHRHSPLDSEPNRVRDRR
jgi:hypothetical protein